MELRDEAEVALATLRERMAKVAQAQHTALAATGEATSRDGTVRVTVDATGVVTALEFADTAFDRSTPTRLAAATVATIQAAAAKARAQLQETLAPLTADSQGALAAARQNVPGLDALTVPEVPRTATDPAEIDEPEPPAGYSFDQPEPDAEPPTRVTWSQSAEPDGDDEDDDGSIIYR